MVFMCHLPLRHKHYVLKRASTGTNEVFPRMVLFDLFIFNRNSIVVSRYRRINDSIKLRWNQMNIQQNTLF